MNILSFDMLSLICNTMSRSHIWETFTGLEFEKIWLWGVAQPLAQVSIYPSFSQSVCSIVPERTFWIAFHQQKGLCRRIGSKRPFLDEEHHSNSARITGLWLLCDTILWGFNFRGTWIWISWISTFSIHACVHSFTSSSNCVTPWASVFWCVRW